MLLCMSIEYQLRSDSPYESLISCSVYLPRHYRQVPKKTLKPHYRSVVLYRLHILIAVREESASDIDAQHRNVDYNTARSRHAAIIQEEFLFENGKVPFPSSHASSIVEVLENHRLLRMSS